MDAELYTLWDGLLFFLLYYRLLIMGILLLIDIHLFTRWKSSPRVRLPALLLAIPVLAGLVWEITIRL